MLELELLLALIIAMITKFLYLQDDKESTLIVMTKEAMEYIQTNQDRRCIS